MKKLSKIMALMMSLILVACSGKTVDQSLIGTYHVLRREYAGVILVGSDSSDLEIELQSNGEGVLTRGGENKDLSWNSEEGSILIEYSEGTIQASIGEDTLFFENLLDLGMNVTLAKEGTEAASPENYMTEEQKSVLGTWRSYAVTDALDMDASAEVAANALEIEFKSDATADIRYNGQVWEGKSCLYGDGYAYFSDDSMPVKLWNIVDEGIRVRCYGEGYYYEFFCQRV